MTGAVTAAIVMGLAGCDDGGITPECFEGAPMAIVVEVDPELSPPPTPTFDCTPDGLSEFCSGGGSVSARVADLIAIRVVWVGLFGWWPWIGIDPESRRARLCATHYTDVGGDDVSQCDPPLCATSGTLRLSRIPTTDEEASGVAVELDVAFDDGTSFRGSFWIP